MIITYRVIQYSFIRALSLRNLSSGIPIGSDANEAVLPQNYFKKKRDCTIYVVKTKALISCAANALLICAFVFL